MSLFTVSYYKHAFPHIKHAKKSELSTILAFIHILWKTFLNSVDFRNNLWKTFAFYGTLI